MPEKKKRKYSWGESICGVIGLMIMINLNLFGDSIGAAGFECGLGWLLGAASYHMIRYFCRVDSSPEQDDTLEEEQG
ncbi:MAG TPA: hypothetical protein ENH94_08820 [Phycisphaerales bacterium]|nr:hypothetical protein [Phycisphaerales bacterium]